MVRTAETAAINDAVATLLTSFAGRGRKMIVYHGLSDQAMATGALTDWYDKLTPRTPQGPQQWARLFLVPGMLHCAGGQATDQFDMLTAIQDWVETRPRAGSRHRFGQGLPRYHAAAVPLSEGCPLRRRRREERRQFLLPLIDISSHRT